MLIPNGAELSRARIGLNGQLEQDLLDPEVLRRIKLACAIEDWPNRIAIRACPLSCFETLMLIDAPQLLVYLLRESSR